METVSVRNYQSLKDVAIELGQFTVIVGPSNSGKSALIRALSAWAFNKSGRDFITSGEKECSVAVGMGDLTVEWKKAASASYEVSDSIDGWNERYSKIGTGVPFDVTQLTMLQRLDIDGLKLTPNFSSQFDAPFLLSESSGKAARAIAKLTKLDVILTASAQCKRDIGRTIGKRSDVEETLQEREAEKDKYSNLPERQELVDSYTSTLEELQAVSEVIDEMWDKLNQLDAAKQQLASIPKGDPKSFTEALDRIDYISSVRRQWSAYQRALARREQYCTEVVEWKKEVECIRTEMQQYGTCPTCGQIASMSTTAAMSAS